MSAPEQKQQPPILDDQEDTPNPYDLIAETDGELPLVDETMQKLLNEMLEAEANEIGGEDATEIIADFKEAPFDEEEFMSHIPYPNIIEGGYEEEQKPKTPKSTPSNKSQGPQQPQQPQQPKKQPKQQLPPKQPLQANSSPQDDDNDGFITVGKNGKPLKTKENRQAIQQQKKANNTGPPSQKPPQQKQPTSTTSTNTTTSQQTKPPQSTKQQQPKNNNNAQKQSSSASKEHMESHRAAAAEIRPKMPGNPSFPFCFSCGMRHDFGECSVE